MISVDLFANDTADENVTVDPKDDVVVQEQKILESVGRLLGAEKLDAILNMAGKILIWLNVMNYQCFYVSICTSHLLSAISISH